MVVTKGDHEAPSSAAGLRGPSPPTDAYRPQVERDEDCVGAAPAELMHRNATSHFQRRSGAFSQRDLLRERTKRGRLEKAKKGLVVAGPSPFGYRMENALAVYVRYIGRLFWPVNMAVLYPFAPISVAATAGVRWRP